MPCEFVRNGSKCAGSPPPAQRPFNAQDRPLGDDRPGHPEPKVRFAARSGQMGGMPTTADFRHKRSDLFSALSPNTAERGSRAIAQGPDRPKILRLGPIESTVDMTGR